MQKVRDKIIELSAFLPEGTVIDDSVYTESEFRRLQDIMRHYIAGLSAEIQFLFKDEATFTKYVEDITSYMSTIAIPYELREEMMTAVQNGEIIGGFM